MFSPPLVRNPTSASNERNVCVDRIDFHVTLMAVAMTSINRFYETSFEGNKMNDGIFLVSLNWNCDAELRVCLPVCLSVCARCLRGQYQTLAFLKWHDNLVILNPLEHLKFRSTSYKDEALCHGFQHARVFTGVLISP